MKSLLKEIRKCQVCTEHLPLGPKPIVTGSAQSKIVIIGQAPGKTVHDTGIPWNDKSGDNLRKWLGVDRDIFYDEACFSLMPMGFCYPGKGKSGDLPPRPECAPLWHGPLLGHMKAVQLILLVGNYAQQFYLGKSRGTTLTATVRQFENYLPRYFPLPHPSPRNNIWQAKNPWFGEEVLPRLKEEIGKMLSNKAGF